MPHGTKFNKANWDGKVAKKAAAKTDRDGNPNKAAKNQDISALIGDADPS